MHSFRKLIVWAGVVALAYVAVLAVLRERKILGSEGRGASGALHHEHEGSRIIVQVLGPDGARLAGASARLFIGPDTRSAHSNRTGEAVIENAPRGKGVLLVEAASFARAERMVEVTGDDIRLRVPLLPGVTLRGRVVDERGTGVPAARVEARRQGRPSAAPWTAVADEQGRFEIDTVVEGLYSLDVSAELHERTVRREVKAPAEKPVRIEIGRTASVHGKVLVARGGKPAGGATVVIAGSGVWPPRKTLAGPDGSYRMDGLPGGFYELRATLDKMVSEPAEGIAVEPGSALWLNLRMIDGLVLRGRVFDAESGDALAGAEITVGEESLTFTSVSVRSGEDGKFEIKGLRDLGKRAHRVSVGLPGYVPVVGQERRPGTEIHPFPLRRGATLLGLVKDESGAPVAGAAIELGGTAKDGKPLMLGAAAPALSAELIGAQLNGSLPFLPTDNLGVTRGAVPPIPTHPVTPLTTAFAALQADTAGLVSDEQGLFRLRGVPPGTVRLTARKSGYAPGTSARLKVSSGSEIGDIVIELPRGGLVEGTLEDERGFPVAGVMVELHSERESLPRTTISAVDGSFTFPNAYGESTVTAYPVALPPTSAGVSIGSGQTRQVKLVLQTRAITLEGRVFDEAGFPVEGASIRVQALSKSSPVRVLARSLVDGTFSVPGLPEPPYELLVEHPDYLPTEAERLTSHEQSVVVRLREGLSLSGAVISAWDRNPLEDAVITVFSRRPRKRFRTRSDPEGKFQFRKLASGNYTALFEKPNYLSERRKVAVESDSKHRREVVINTVALSSGGTISGEVVDRFGAPVPGAKVALGSPPDWRKAVRTDAEGRFSRSNIPPGDVVLTARHPSAGKAAAGRAVRIYPLQETPGVVIRLPGSAPQADNASETQADATRTPDADEPQTPTSTSLGAYPMEMAYEKGRVVVTEVAAGSRFRKAGFRKGDAVVSVNGERVLSVGQARGMMRVPAGSKARVVVRRRSRTVRLLLSP